MRSPIEWMGGKREKELLNFCGKHLDEILNTVKGMRETLYLFCDHKVGKIEESSEKAAEMERKADEIKGKILHELSMGEFHPASREEIIRLVLTADDVAENARAAAKKLNLVSPDILENDLKSDLKDFSDLILQTVEQLRTSLSDLVDSPKSAVEATNKVEKLEEKIDIFRAGKITPEIVKCADRSGKPGTSIVLKEVTDNMEEIADQSENVADVVRSIAIAST